MYYCNDINIGILVLCLLMNKHLIHLMAQMILLFIMICLVGDSATILSVGNGFLWVSSWCKHVTIYYCAHPFTTKW